MNTVTSTMLTSTNALILDTITTSNINILGSNYKVDVYTIATSIFSICNITGFGPALSVYQKGTGANYPIADFYDIDVSVNIPALRIADGANVGIGTALPRQKLDVIGTQTSTARFSPPNGTVSSVSALQLWGTFDNYPSDTGTRYSSRIFGGFSGGSGVWGNEFMAFSVGSNSIANDAATDPIERMRIIGNGNIGIGTTLPRTTLHTQGDHYVSGISKHEAFKIIAVSDETTALTIGTAKVTFRAPFAMTLTRIPRASVNTVSTSGNPTVDIKVNTVSIFSRLLSIDANENHLLQQQLLLYYLQPLSRMMMKSRLILVQMELVRKV